MSEELLKVPDGVVADFHARLQGDSEQPTAGDHGNSLIREVEKLQAEVAALRDNVAQLCQAVRGLVQLQAIANQKLDSAIRGSADCAVL